MKIFTLKDDGWELENAELLHENSPEKFQMPSKEEILNLKIGEVVKLRFLFWEHDNPNNNRVTGESMWVRIKSISGNDINGILDNTPVRSKVLSAHDSIDFNRENVCAIYIRTNDPRHPHYKKATHNKLLQRIKKSCAFFYR